MTFILSLLLKFGFGGLVDKTIAHMEKRAEMENDRERLRAQVSIEHIRAAVEENRNMVRFNEAKLGHWAFWLFTGFFVGGLGLWWNAVILDSIFHFGWKIADLPTPEMRAWAGDMIRWLFYTGTVAGAIRVLR